MGSVAHRDCTDDGRGTAHSRPPFAACARAFLARLPGILLLAGALGATPTAHAQTGPAAPGTLISNTAVLELAGVDGQVDEIFSNAVTATVEPVPTLAAVTLLRPAQPGPGAKQTTAGPTACRTGSDFVALPPPVLPGGITVDPEQPITMAPTGTIQGGEAVFVQVTDGDRNRDAAAIDTVEVRVTSDAGDSETIRVSETGVDTGVFVGYVQTMVGAVVPEDCALQVAPHSRMSSSYIDPLDPQDSAGADALVDPVDPYGLVFDSATGQPLDGVQVRLIDAATGQPAVVRGDDGVSRYPASIVTGSEVTDAGGTVYALPPGAYRFPLVAPGEYRLEITPPSTHAFPSERSVAELNTLPGAPFDLQAGSFGNNFVLGGPAAVAIDVPLDPGSTELFLQKTTTTAMAAPGDFVQYTLTVENTNESSAQRAVRIDDRLPWGVRYREGSTRIGAQPGADPVIGADGQGLTFVLGNLAPRERVTITYVAEITQRAREAELTNTAQASSDNGTASNPAQVTIRLREDFFTSKAIVVGRVVEGDCAVPSTGRAGVAGIRVYLEDGRYSVTDDTGKYHFEGVEPGSHVVQIDTESIPDEFEPALCTDNVAHSGRAYSKFIDVRGGALWRADFDLARRGPATDGAANESAPHAVERQSADEPPADSNTGDARAKDGPEPRDAADVEALQPGIEWLAPQDGAIPAIASVKVAIAHRPGQSVELLVNRRPASALNFEGTTANRAGTAAVSRWMGIDLLDGANELEAIVRNADGGEAARLVRAVHFAGGAVRAELVPEQSSLVADGTTRSTIALRMFDASGQPARPGTQGAFAVNAPYRSQWEVDSFRDNPLLAIGTRQATFRVDDDGIARIELAPTTQTGNATLRLQFNERQTQDLRVWLKPEPRDWIMVGIAEGTGAYQTVSRNLQSARSAGFEEGVDSDGRVAFFAKGRIKGEYLVTLAYDSERDREIDEQRLFGAIEPDRYYTVYGDGTEQRFEAASSEKLYLKLERDQFMALFGDLETGLTVTELSRYSRSLTGIASDYVGERFEVTAFAAETGQGYARDELPGDGTSGLYRLSQGSIIANTDKVRLETRDRFKSEVVIESRELSRFIDYSIDYFAGTIFFKQPVPSRDERFNPVYVVAEYEVLQSGSDQLVGGTRGALKFAEDAIELGASYVQEGADAGDTQLAGADLRVRLGEHSQLRAEAARSESDDPARASGANAYFAELTRVSDRVDAGAYYREEQSEFGFGQQMSTESGTRKLGLDSRMKLADTAELRTEAFQQSMLTSGAERLSASLEARHQTDRYGIGVGARHTSDDGLAGESLVSDLATVNANVSLWGDRVLLKAAHEQAFNGAAESIDYPERSLVGVDYKVSRDTTLFGEYEQTDGAAFSSDMTRIGVRTSPWQRAQLTSGLNQQFTEYGPRLFANLGLIQGWQINERWSMDFGIDQSNTVRGSELREEAEASRNPFTPLASGSLSDDFLATSVAAMYRAAEWTMTSRAENLNSDNEERWNYAGGMYREAISGHAFSLQANWLANDARATGNTDMGLLRLSWAHRPVESQWIVLDRLDLKRDDRSDAVGDVESSRIVNNLNANWQVDARTQLGVQWGVRYVVSTFDGERYEGFSDLYGADVRRDLSRRFDLGFRSAWLHSWDAGTGEGMAGLDLGITVARNMWVSVGYNFTGFDDDDFSASGFSAQGPFIRLRMKFDQDTFKELSLADLRPPAGRAGQAR